MYLADYKVSLSIAYISRYTPYYIILLKFIDKVHYCNITRLYISPCYTI